MENKLKKMIDGKEVAICGIGKFQEDFEYVFETLKPKFYIADDFDGKTYKGLDVYRTTELKQCSLDNILIIVCDLHAMAHSEREWNRLEQVGYKKGEDFIFAEELFPTLNFDIETAAAGRKIAIWGTGIECRKFYLSNNIRADVFIDQDRSKQGKTFNGVEIVHPEQIERWEAYYIIVMIHTKYHEVFEFLKARGLKEVEDFASYRMVYDSARTYARPSEMMQKVVYSLPIEGQPFCEIPFHEVRLGGDGRMTGCGCSAYVDEWWAPFGNYTYEPYEKMWHSVSARIFRLSILNQTYCFCREELCKDMSATRIENEMVARRESIQESETPLRIVCDIDDVCNLACPSCRKTPKYLEDGPDYQRRMSNAEKLKESGWLEKADLLNLAGYGEVFYSRVYRNLLYHNETKKRKHIMITTNGMLFNENEFLHLMEDYEKISVVISIDGTDKLTYEKLRPGARFETLVRTLEMLSKHRQSGELSFWGVNFVVQKENYIQMKDMIRWAEKLGVDTLYFMQILNLMQDSKTDFDKVNMANGDGSLKSELVQYLDDPIFNHPIVYMPWFKSHL